MRFIPCLGSEQPPLKIVNSKGICVHCNRRIEIARDRNSWKCVIHRQLRIRAAPGVSTERIGPLQPLIAVASRKNSCNRAPDSRDRDCKSLRWPTENVA